MKVLFDTVNVYYIPQYLPICKKLLENGHHVKFVCYKNKNNVDVFDSLFKSIEIDYQWVSNEQEAAQLYVKEKPHWVFFGNAFSYLDEVHKVSKTAQLGHGIGPKPSYYHKSKTPMTVRFMEGELRLKNIKKLYPNDEFVQVGYSKLDPLFNNEEMGIDLVKLNLDPNKPTLLYAPTFNPSSLECFPDDWPKHFSEYNVLIKPHTFTYTREQYKKQRRKLAKWATFDNAYVASSDVLSLVPFLKTADILISEASSTLFEFVSLDKPVIVCDFFKLKWSYRGVFRYRFKKRFGKDNVLYREIGTHIKSFNELKPAVNEQLNHPEHYQSERKRYTIEHVGPTDGNVSKRIVEYLENN